ncbi:EVE domain-containing protein [Legionella israelensis]|uniref:EVE domain protein n=1 Tax=Legionella israelensis TaxID=454 RepID=A0A0W0WQC3_9GAMM|nr:EVE domain-containing protein [Legionella israelensis]KTD34521.1 EVE domain protein [Legionella israelensis]QBR83376.1 EVE domain-containing protein [Legionella israelensis]QBS09245.1 EVE domain-containing protein [Legionella israelensis]QDP71902.1 EVE domain-containing protein [Legionella israelensis]SCX98312.1 Predicted RNA-binding protein, contains PUA-like domain [Legionella israelensis DSM 19235]
MTQYWLMKSEPSCFSIDDLYHSPNQTTHWDGVRNYQARNFMKNDMKIGDQIFFYHSNCKPPGIVGIAEVSSEAYPDYTAFDPESDHPDSQSTPDNPRWFMVDIRFKEKFDEIIPLDELKKHEELADMPLVKKGNRLSVMPVSEKAWNFIQRELR